mmetsp:Transcript_52745/g.105872  ORF Transcript_52745/g.105872 Transcript_52745/m.105872 type:complete len:240 (+) Transcript_52745:51-770(+)
MLGNSSLLGPGSLHLRQDMSTQVGFKGVPPRGGLTACCPEALRHSVLIEGEASAPRPLGVCFHLEEAPRQAAVVVRAALARHVVLRDPSPEDLLGPSIQPAVGPVASGPLVLGRQVEGGQVVARGRVEDSRPDVLELDRPADAAVHGVEQAHAQLPLARQADEAEPLQAPEREPELVRVGLRMTMPTISTGNHLCLAMHHAVQMLPSGLRVVAIVTVVKPSADRPLQRLSHHDDHVAQG